MVVVPVTADASFLGNVFSFTNKTTEAYTVESIQTASILDVPMLTPVLHFDPNRALGGGEVIVDDGVLISTGPVGAEAMVSTKRSSDEISVYIVRAGDSLSQIAEMYGVTTNTILWANDLPRATAIKPGDTLIILPVAGVRHIVKTGDTIASLAKKYRGDVEEIEIYNQLTVGETLTVGSTLVIPGGSLYTEPRHKVVASTGANIATSNTFLSHPVPGAIRTQGIHGYNAVDLAAKVGTPIKAAATGEVIVSKNSGWNGGYGNYIVIKHNNGVQTLYSHLSRNDVGVGARVGVGQVIGALGNTGKSTGPHLHFEVRGARNPF